METRTFHGSLTPTDLGRVLVSEFNRGNLQAQLLGNDKQVVVQIASRQRREAGGQTALSINLQKVEDGVAVQIGSQAWLGVAASLGQTAFSLWRNPWNILNRLDDLAQDIENIQLSEQAWRCIETASRAAGASYELSERLRRLECPYCHTANLVGEASCIACGAPLGEDQPRTCSKCGFVVKGEERTCPNCGQPL